GVDSFSEGVPAYGGAERQDGHRRLPKGSLYSPAHVCAQESQWLDSVSLLMKDSFEGEMLMIDNLSGSVFHHYCPSTAPACKNCKGPLQEIRLAEAERASLMSDEQMSDRSSSLALPDDLSLYDHSVCQLMLGDRQVENENNESHSFEDLRGLQSGNGGCTWHGGSLLQSRGPADGAGGLAKVGVYPQIQSHPPQFLPHTTADDRDIDHSGVSSRESPSSSSVFHLPAEFFHPVTATPPPSPRPGVSPRGTVASSLPSRTSWASLRSPGTNSRVLGSQHASHSDSSLGTGSSEGSLQTTMEEGLSFSVSPPRGDLGLPLALPLLCPLPMPQRDETRQTPRPLGHPSLRGRSTAFNLQATRGHQRSQSSCGGSTSPGCPRQDSMEPSDDDCGIGTGGEGCSQAFNSEQLSETLSSLSLMSLLSPSSLVPPLVQKCNSTGSLDQANLSVRSKDGRQYYRIEAQGYLPSPWTEEAGREDGKTGFGVTSMGQSMDAGSRKNR
ncbi:hypothetical protein UPYG_G00061980, partial [Umbra pygmaea]